MTRSRWVDEYALEGERSAGGGNPIDGPHPPPGRGAVTLRSEDGPAEIGPAHTLETGVSLTAGKPCLRQGRRGT